MLPFFAAANEGVYQRVLITTTTHDGSAATASLSQTIISTGGYTGNNTLTNSSRFHVQDQEQATHVITDNPTATATQAAALAKYQRLLNYLQQYVELLSH